ncbi:hypothetical protein EDC01DRAFT_635358 [Geopyxis carbonaria]|nr:hypothetical protein EDC01DRAFT_635358 [Geopyxis carbonaria]
MVNLTASSVSSSPATSAIQQNSGLISQQNEEGCNDEPPPIPLPPAGHADSLSSSQQPAGGVHLPSHLHDLTPKQDNNGTSNEGQSGVRSYDYGSKSNGPGVEVNRHDVSPTGSGEILQHMATGGSLATTTTSSASTPFRSVSRASTESSMTAVDPPSRDVVVDIPVGAFDGTNPHTVGPESVATALGVSLSAGLNTADAQQRLEKDGPNKLTSDGGLKWYTVLGRQVSNSLTLVS